MQPTVTERKQVKIDSETQLGADEIRKSMQMQRQGRTKGSGSRHTVAARNNTGLGKIGGAASAASIGKNGPAQVA
jgi:hypothetical protein